MAEQESTPSDSDAHFFKAHEVGSASANSTLFFDMATCGSETENPSGPIQPSGKASVGRYKIGVELATGGMGEVVEGWDEQLQRRVAIKKLRSDQIEKPNSLTRFYREARIAGRLQHPSIITIYEFDFASDGAPYMVMELLEGQTLKQWLDSIENRHAILPSLINTFLQVCQAISYAHANGVIHRDLKPANIMVGHFGTVTVLDWGLAKSIGSMESEAHAKHTKEQQVAPIAQEPNQRFRNSPHDDPSFTMSGAIFGTPNYLPPEQARGEQELVDEHSDIFGLGAILCEMLTGAPPFSCKHSMDNVNQAANGNLDEAIQRLDESIGPRAIVRLAKQCLAPNPAERPKSASVLVETVTEFLESGQRRAEQDLVRFFDLSLDLFCIANLSGFFCRVNDNFSRLLGHSAADLTSRRFLDFVHPEDVSKTLAVMAELSLGEPVIRFINRYRHLDGRYLWFEWTARAEPDEGAIYAVARDISDRVAVAEKSQGLSTV